MTKNYALILFFCFLFSGAQTTKKVLFLGNSYTQYNNLANLVQQMATSTNDVLIQNSNLIGGYRFMDHVTNQTSLNQINSNDWDYVVLQEQSQMPAFPINYVNNNVFPFATQLTTIVKQNYSCSVPMFYVTWGRKNGDAQNCPSQPALCTYIGMDDLLQQRYRTMAETNNGVLSPVAAVWRYIRLNHPTIELFSADESHPSLEGSMAAAYTFYTAIFKKDPTLVTFNSSISPATATLIKNAVKTVVFNNQENWLIDVNDNYAYFTANIVSGNNVQFTNTTLNATNISWNFGDGGTSNQQNPTHNFATNGSYTVTMTLTVCNKTYSKTKEIIISNLSNEIFSKEEVKLYPNPTSDYLNLNGDKIENVSVFDVLGKKVKVSFESSNNQTKIDIKHLEKGSYTLQISKGNSTKSYKFIKQ